MKRITSIIMTLIVVASVFGGCSLQTTTRNDISVAEVVDFHSDKQEKYINSDYDRIGRYANGKKDISTPEPIIISWSEENSAEEYTVKLSESPDMQNAEIHTASEAKLPVYNLKIGTKYYWSYSTDDYQSEVFSFTTSSDAPRNLYVEGVQNVRDLGGWKTESGKTVNQGLIYRCGRLNESSADSPVIEITENGIAVMKDYLGVKSEIDVRKANGETGAITSSPLGVDVNYYHCPMQWEDDIFTENKEPLLKVFEILSKRDNYPVIFHCNIGTDRTGMIAFLVNALCGVCEEDLKRDYLFSNFASINGKRKISDLENSGYYKAVMQAKGNTLSKKAYNSLVTLGVPKAQLDSIIEILTE